jgi:AcrR family transcriptional regulator
MPKKTKYTRVAVIEAGLKQLKESGWEDLTPKSVAKKLGASTMPIFSHFATMDEFRVAILDRAWEMHREYISKSYTGDIWLDQGIGYVLFARDHSQIFSCMDYGRLQEIRDRRLRFWEFASRQLEGYPAFEGLSAEHVGWIRHLRSLLTHGIAVSVSSGFAPIWKDEEVIKQMLSLCSEILFTGLSDRRNELDEITKIIPSEARKRLRRVLVK